ncbi:MAG: hypothetical protein ACRENS_05110 [Candidatus Eiseniibacteriota bacterium]
MSSRSGRPRVARRALDSARHAPLPALAARRRIADALAACSADERNLLALLLAERLSPAEASLALELPAAEVLRARDALIETLRRALLGGPTPRVALPRPADAPSLRRAS